MSRVRRLEERVVERIAAGEVITRPADAVVELVENALDAGATSVEVAVERGGIDHIRVADDGHGMSRADAELAVERHTTSKLDGVDTLERVDTLGFRGEALASIAHVGRLTLTTGVEGAVEGTRVVVADGERRVEPAGHGVGTTVEVEELFHAMPARQESLASPGREFARISERVSRYALCHPDTRFRLSHDGRTVLSAPGTGLRDALLAVYDRSVAAQSLAVDSDAGADAGSERDGEGVTVTGRVCTPGVTRATTDHVHVAVNGRAVDAPAIRRAVRAAYGSTLPAGREPVGVVQVSLAPTRVDVNVHPSKERVRFADPDAVAEAVERAVRDALAGSDRSRRATFDLDELPALDRSGANALADVAVIGQHRELYLLCASGDDLLVVDQHAAHERVNYERLRAAAGNVESVSLDGGVTLSLTPGESAVLEACRDAVEALGFRVEPFGGNAVRVTGMPAPLDAVAGPEAVRDVLDEFLTGERPDDPRDALLADLACHPSFRAGDTLDDEAAAELVARLGACEEPFACPHGRPTVLTIEEATLARSFERGATRLD